ncbi:hypothetical protein HAX54_049957, partial [Datura stramonium]|nr:hypothetical protein [Datura stramonium]
SSELIIEFSLAVFPFISRSSERRCGCLVIFRPLVEKINTAEVECNEKVVYAGCENEEGERLVVSAKVWSAGPEQWWHATGDVAQCLADRRRGSAGIVSNGGHRAVVAA